MGYGHSAVSWGLTVSPRSQKFMTYVTLIVFVLLSYVGVRAIFSFRIIRIGES